jgi:hypothetical protein
VSDGQQMHVLARAAAACDPFFSVRVMHETCSRPGFEWSPKHHSKCKFSTIHNR